MLTPGGEVRPHWREFVGMLSKYGYADMLSRRETIQRSLHDQGVTYNIYDDTQGSERPWALDLIPVIIRAAEWRRVAEGLEQRARLLNLILADIYGPQRLLHEGWIPPALVFANPGYLRPVRGIAPGGGQFVITMASDLVRTADGVWRVLADRAQAPSGKGYTLENRIVLSAVWPEEFRECRVQRLAAFYEAEREAIRNMAPSRRGSPSVVFYTPGPLNETYFEHAFKARYLGFPIVEGADLTVRDRRVHLKTLDGLHRVDVIVRRVDDTFCDPLELREDTMLGVPGLLEAWRAGNVSIANGLGAGAAETPALYPFMPGLCKHLLGEELKLPCVPTWWLGQKRELNMVLANPERWVVKLALGTGKRQPIFLSELDAKKRAEQLAMLRADPQAWVAQEVLALSTTPTFINGSLQPRPLVWRAFTAASENGFEVMPGGLSRVSADARRHVVTMQSGGISKDTWVLADGPVDQRTLLPSGPAVMRPARPPGGVPSRVADHLFWLGRYAERLEQTTRVLRTVLQRLSGEGSEMQRRELQACVRLLHSLGLSDAAEIKQSHLVKDQIQPLFGTERDGSIGDLIGRLRFNAAAARDRLSDDTWRIFNRLEHDAKPPQGSWYLPDALAFLDTLVLRLSAFSGMQQENMTRGHGWRFLEIGRRLERALNVITLCGSTAAAGEDESILYPLLDICDSSMTYRRLHFARPKLAQVLDLLLLNETNPRSAAFQFTALCQHCTRLPFGLLQPEGISEKERADALSSKLSNLNLEAVANAQPQSREFVTMLCSRLSVDLEDLSERLSAHYFSHAVRQTRN